MSRPLLVIFLTIFVNLIGFGIVMPLLPIYSEQMGASDLVIGVIVGSYSFTQLLATPVLGELSDRIGRRPVLLFSIFGTVVGFVVLALAHNVWVLLLGRVIDGLSGGNISIARAYIADISKPENRAKAFGLIGAAFGLGFILGPALGGIFAKVSYTAPLWVATGLTVVALALAWLWLPETVERRDGAAVWPLELKFPLFQMMRRNYVRQLLLVDFIYWCAAAGYQTTLPLIGKHRFGFGVSEVGFLMASLGLVSVLVQVALIGRAVKKLGERRTILVALVVSAVWLEVAALSERLIPFSMAMVVASIGTALFMPALSSLLARSADRSEQGKVQGAASAVESLGRSAGPVFGNVVLGKLGGGVAYGIVAALFGVGTLLTLVLDFGPKEAPLAPAPGAGTPETHPR
jgi:MFS transporter, DHA1 family, tetracycline resistance protein